MSRPQQLSDYWRTIGEMATVLHTADVHLTPDEPARMAALRSVLEAAEAEDADALTVGGDLFEGPADAESLRPTLRNDLFTDRPFPVVVIPGNHDGDAFEGDVFFGDACRVLTDDPFEQWVDPAEQVRITGIPFRSAPDDDLLFALRDREPFAGTDVLLLHCSLDAPFDGHETGDESDARYFPVSRNALADLGFDVHLAGHYHSQHRLELADGSTFVYPGSPASTRTTETGRRRVALLDTDAGAVEFRPLDTFRYERGRFTVTPGAEDRVLSRVRSWASEHAVAEAAATVHVDGFHATDEAAFHERLVAAAGDAEVTDDTRNVRPVLAHPLFAEFEAELEARDWDEETTTAVRERTVEVFARLLARGEI